MMLVDEKSVLDTVQRVIFGRATLTFRRGRFSFRTNRRSLAVFACLALAVLTVVAVSVMTGTAAISLGDVVAIILGTSDNAAQTMVLLGWRLPRALIAVVCGIALALSGAVFQSLTKNPLGSPDVIGFSAGSYTGAVVVMLWLGSTAYYTIGLGTIFGGLATAAVVYFLAYRRDVQSFRLIIVGIGVSELLSSFNALLLIKVSPERAMLAASWSAGSLNSLGFEQFWP